MSSRHDSRRRDRSWERDERDRDRYPRRGGRRDSRSRSPPRRGDRRPDRRDDKRDYGRPRDDDRRDRDRYSSRDYDRPRDDHKDRNYGGNRDSGKEREREYDRRATADETTRSTDKKLNEDRAKVDTPGGSGSVTEHLEDGEETSMDAVGDDEEAMMATMGLSGFGSTKGKQVDGNQEGGVNIKKQRTWRQYMNRRGGFNRPLDKIK